MKRMHSSRIVIQALPAHGGPDCWFSNNSKGGTKPRKLNSKAAFSRGNDNKNPDDVIPSKAKRVRNKQNRRCSSSDNTDHMLGAPLRITSHVNNSHCWSSENIKSRTQIRSCIEDLSAWKVKKRRSIMKSKYGASENNVRTCEQVNAASIPGKYLLDNGRSSEMEVDTCYEGDLVMRSSETGTCLRRNICDGAEETNRNNPSKSSGTDNDVETCSGRCIDISKDHHFVALDSKSVSEIEIWDKTVSNVGNNLTSESGDFVKVNNAAIELMGLQRYPRLEVVITYSRKRRKNSSAPANSLPSIMTDVASSTPVIENKTEPTSPDHYQVSLSYRSNNASEETTTAGGTLLMGVQQILLEKAADDRSVSEAWNEKEKIQVDDQKEHTNSSMASIKDESAIDSKAENYEQDKRNETDVNVNVAHDIAWNQKENIQVDNQKEHANSSMASIKDESAIDSMAENYEQDKRNETDVIVNVVRDIAWNGKEKIQFDNRKEHTNSSMAFIEDESAIDSKAENYEHDKRNETDAIVNVVHDIEFAKDSSHYASSCDFKASNDSHSIVTTNEPLNGERQSETEGRPQSRASAFVDGKTQITKVGINPPLGRVLNACPSRKLLVLDVNGLLADIVPLYHVPYTMKPDIVVSGKAVFKRPFHDDFLQFCFERFNVGVWSSRIKRNMELVLDVLLGNAKNKLLFCWDQSHCTDTGFPVVGRRRNKPIILKKLKKLWDKYEPDLPWEKGEYDESNTLLLDDSPHKALCNPPNTAIFPNSYHFRDWKDDSLGPGGDLRVYLEGLSMAENVQKYVECNPFGQRAITEKNASWRYYRKVIEAATYLQESGANRFSTYRSWRY